MLKRRQILQSGAAVALGSPLFAAHGAPVVTLKFQTFVPASSNLWSRVVMPWMQKVEKESGGRIKFEGYTSMQLGGTAPQLLDQARDGVVDLVWTLTGYTAGRFPSAEVFELPFMTYDGEGSSKAVWEFMNTHAAGELKDVRFLAFHTHGLNVLHTRRKAVKTVADLRGMKFRGPTRRATQILAALGAIPVGMPLPQIPDALSKGVIEGAMIPWDTAPSAKLDELTTYHTEFPKGMPGLNNSTQIMVMNSQSYEKLPADLKKVIDNNSGLELSGWFGRQISAYDPVVRKSVIDRGNTVHVVDKAEVQEFMKRSESVTAEWVKDMNERGADGNKLLASARALIGKYKPAA